ncbi:MAG TPA: protein kinase [Gemmatimonadales bacterium]|nr:protein kinase [Gemmatimonadales bacterium]
MFCSRCGSEITGKSKFCPSCGLDLMATTPVHAIATGALQEMDLVREALASEYEIIEELGRGGMAMVYRARDRHLEREVAIKVLPFSLAFDAEFVERFQREARTAAQLEHPNIIPIYRVGRSGRVIYFVMKFLRGGSLSTVMAERRKLTPPEIRRLLVEAGGALGYAAQRGIVHRDIKPDNFMFDEFGQCVLTDFGIAKAASGQRLTGTGMSIGTPHYMSPEQARAQAIDGRSDIYSLGVVAYQALTGTVPYDGEDSFSIGYKHITEPVPVPQLITADERRIFEVIKRMLMKDPADRYQSCEELVASIQGQPIAVAGSVRASVATVAAGANPGSGSISPVVGGAPLIVSQPTTPIESPLVNRRMTPRERRDEPRRVADRSLAMRGSGSSLAWIWVVLAVLGGIGGGFYYYKSRGFATGVGASDSTGSGTAIGDSSAAAPPADSAPVAATPSAPAPPRTPAVTTPPASPPPAPASPSSRSGGAATPAARGDSGAIRLIGLPRGSTVMIDERPALEAVTRLSPGPHALAVSAPRFNFFTDTVTIAAGDTLVLTPQLQPIGAPAAPPREAKASRCEPGPGYNSDGSCFDERPKPVNPPFVPLPDGVTGEPRPSLLWVKVSAEGRTIDVQRLRSSDNADFERAVRDFVWTVTWHPALKDGAPVEAWTQMLFPPQQP